MSAQRPMINQRESPCDTYCEHEVAHAHRLRCSVPNTNSAYTAGALYSVMDELGDSLRNDDGLFEFKMRWPDCDAAGASCAAGAAPNPVGAEVHWMQGLSPNSPPTPILRLSHRGLATSFAVLERFYIKASGVSGT